MSATPLAPQPARRSALVEFGDNFGVQPAQVFEVLKQTILPNASNAQVQAFVGVCNIYRLNPFLRQIWAYPDKRGGIVPMVSIDGWIAIVQANDRFDGEEFEYGPPMVEGDGIKPQWVGIPQWIECRIYRKDRTRPTVVREYLRENWRNTDPWNNMPNRFLRHRAYIQAARVSFGLGGIYDPDEGDRIINGDVRDITASAAAVDDLNKRLDASKGPTTIENQPSGVPVEQVVQQQAQPAEQADPGPGEQRVTPKPPAGAKPPEATERAASDNPPAGRTDATAGAQWDIDGILQRIDAATTLQQCEAAARLASHLKTDDERAVVGKAYADRKKALAK